MAHSYILEGMRVARRWDLSKPDPEVGFCVGEKRMGMDLGSLISWPDGREMIHSISGFVPLDEDGKPAPLMGQANVSNEEIESAFSNRFGSSGDDE